MTTEIEAKYKVQDVAFVRQKLHEAGAEYRGTFLQTDEFYDTPQQNLRSSDRGLRIRRVSLIEGQVSQQSLRPQLTFKGPREKAQRAKQRLELQTCLEDPQMMSQILQGIGLAPTLTIQKLRASFHLGRCQVELDELPLLGYFVEIEGETIDAVEEAARLLGMESEPITTPYVELAATKCSHLHSDCRAITFQGCKECKKRT